MGESQYSMKGKWINTVWIGGLAIFVAYALYPLFIPAGKKADGHRTHCIFLVKHLATSMLMYAEDNDGYVPKTDWADATYIFVRNESVYHCPQATGRYGFALYRPLVGQN